MPQGKDLLQKKLAVAQARRAEIEGQLGDQTPKKNPHWRHANAAVTQLEYRLKRFEEIRGAVATAPAESSEEE